MSNAFLVFDRYQNLNLSFVKHKILVRPIYVTVHNLNSEVSGKPEACTWRVLNMVGRAPLIPLILAGNSSLTILYMFSKLQDSASFRLPG